MEIRIAGLIEESVVDGPGLRFVVFGQGCFHRCPDCHNPKTWKETGGDITSTEEIYTKIKKCTLLSGVTFSGGEPFLQAKAFAQLGKMVKELGLDIITYTGYLYEELEEMAKIDPDIAQLLELTDILVDGPFQKATKDLNLPFRGSSNQRAINLSETRTKGVVINAF